MKKCLFTLLTLLLVATVLPWAVFAENDERSVKITVPEKKVSLDEPIEITVTFTGLDETLEKISISAPRFKISDSKGNTHSTRLTIHATDLPAEAFTGVYRETYTLTWVEMNLEKYSAGDIMHALGPIEVSLIGDGYGRIEMDADGGYVLDNPYSDHYWFSVNEKYIAFSAESQEQAAEKLTSDPTPWIIGTVAVLLVLATGVVCVILHRKHMKNNQA